MTGRVPITRPFAELPVLRRCVRHFLVEYAATHLAPHAVTARQARGGIVSR